MSIFKCKMCGGTIEFNEGDTIGVCDSCGTKQTLPRLDSDRKANLYDRANHFRRNNEFDKAMSIYENILNEDQTDAEAYWSIVLCRYGIEYVEEPATHRRVPTVNRAQFTSIFDDEDYKSALKNADALQRSIYEDEARTINEIQKGILEISSKEEPFDVFICYKETDANGRRTPDSVLATDLYHQLTNEGFKVFFSRITLEDKLGQEYEPYIFAALNSANAMVVLGTKPEHFNAVWVKNEWSRYLALIKAGAKKTLIPAYRDMDPYDLPDEFSHLQAQDMSKLGFMQDLIRGIKKIVKTDEPKPIIKETVVTPAATAATAPLLRRAFMFLEDGEWQSADEYCEKVLDVEPENAKAYLGKLMAELKVRKCDDLKDQPVPFDDRNNYKKAVRFGNDALKKKLTDDVAFINDRNETARKEGIYQDALAEMKKNTKRGYHSAILQFGSIIGYRDAQEKIRKCEEAQKDIVYESAEKVAKLDSIVHLEAAVGFWKSIPEWRDADKRIIEAQRRIEQLKKQENRLQEEANKRNKKTKKAALMIVIALVLIVAALIVLFTVILPNKHYKEAVELYNAGQYEEAIAAFETMDGYRDSETRILDCKYGIAEDYFNAGEYDQASLMYHLLNGYRDSKARIEACETAIKDQKYDVAVALYNTGKYDEAITAFETMDGYRDSKAQIEACETAIKDQKYTAAVEMFEAGQYEAAIVSFAALNGYKDSAERIEACETAINDRDYDAAVALYNAGKYEEAFAAFIAMEEYKSSNQYLVECWNHVAVRDTIAAGNHHTVGLRSDGTVVATKLTGQDYYGQCDVSDWTDIVAIAAGVQHTVGLRSDGTVVAVGDNSNGQCNISDWTNIVAIAGGGHYTVGLRSDGTVVAIGENKYGQCDVSGRTDIVAIAAEFWRTVGLKSDGTVVAVGNNLKGQCNVSGWKDIIAIAAGVGHTVGLKSDGTVVAAGNNEFGQCDISDWKDIKLPKQ